MYNKYLFFPEIQLKPHHKLLTIYQKWPLLEEKYCIQDKKTIFKKPILSFQRNVFFPRKDEEKIKFVDCLI